MPFFQIFRHVTVMRNSSALSSDHVLGGESEDIDKLSHSQANIRGQGWER